MVILKLVGSTSEKSFLYYTRKNSEVDKMLSGNPPESIEKHLNYLDKAVGISRWIYIAYDGDTKVGYSQVYDITKETLEIGFVIHPDHQGRGYGKSLVFETISKAKERFPDKKVILYVLRDNPKAIHIYKKLGFIEKELPSTDEGTVGMELFA